MLIYRDINAIAAPTPGRFELPAFEQRHDAREPAPTAEEINEADDGLRAEEMEIPADADGGAPLDELLAAGSSLLDDMLARAQPRTAPAVQQQPRSTYRPAHARSFGLQPQYGPGSRTRQVGVNDHAVGSNAFGDGSRNVLRDNMRHFGLSGTRSR